MRKHKKILGICILWVVCLLIAAVLFWWHSAGLVSNEDYVSRICPLIPEPQGAVLEARRDNTMSILSLDGVDFVGILEMPGFDSALPVCAQWGNRLKYPCCFSGSIYDGTLQIGTTSRQGQYDFYREISIGDALYFTDMEGNCYGFTVSDLRYEKKADQETLNRKEADLTLFIKNVYGFDYLIVYCNTPK